MRIEQKTAAEKLPVCFIHLSVCSFICLFEAAGVFVAVGKQSSRELHAQRIDTLHPAETLEIIRVNVSSLWQSHLSPVMQFVNSSSMYKSALKLKIKTLWIYV